MMIDKLNLEELTIGAIFVNNDAYKVTEDEIIVITKQNNPQVFHTDSEKAKDTFSNILVSTGWLTADISMHFTAQSFPIAGVLIGAKADLIWPSVTSFGDK